MDPPIQSEIHNNSPKRLSHGRRILHLYESTTFRVRIDDVTATMYSERSDELKPSSFTLDYFMTPPMSEGISIYH